MVLVDETPGNGDERVLAPHHHVLNEKLCRGKGDGLPEVLGQQHLAEESAALGAVDQRQGIVHSLQGHGRADSRRVLQRVDHYAIP